MESPFKYRERMDREESEVTILIRKNQIKNPKIKYYKPTKHSLSKDKILVIDENGMNFLKDNYPIDKWGLKEVKDEKIVLPKSVYWNVTNSKSYYIGKHKDGTDYGEHRKKIDKEKGVIRYYVKNNWNVVNEKVEVILKGYKQYHYDSNGRLLMEEYYKDIPMGIDKWGNFTYWDNRNQKVRHCGMFLGGSGTMFHQSNRLRVTKRGVKDFFNDFYHKTVMNQFFRK